MIEQLSWASSAQPRSTYHSESEKGCPKTTKFEGVSIKKQGKPSLRQKGKSAPDITPLCAASCFQPRLKHVEPPPSANGSLLFTDTLCFFFFKKNTKTKQKEKHFGGSCLHLCKIFLIFYPTAPFALPFASREFPAPSLI